MNMFVVLLVNNECFVFALFLAFLRQFNTTIILLVLTGNHNLSRTLYFKIFYV